MRDVLLERASYELAQIPRCGLLLFLEPPPAFAEFSQLRAHVLDL